MRRLITLIMAVILTLSCMTVVAFGDDSLDDVLNKVEQTEQQVETKTDRTATTENKEQSNDVYDKNRSFIDGLNKAADVSAEVEGVSGVTSGAKTAVAFVVQILAYCITILLALRVVLDLAFIAIPFTRTFLGNGYMGNAQAGAGGIPNSMGMGGMGMGGMGMGGHYGGRYGGMGMGMNPGMAGGMNAGMGMGAGQQPNVTGRIQWVSNAALNAVAGENTVGVDGKAVSPFKLYIKDMTVVLVIVPILITLAVTGALTSLGFVIAQLIVDGLGKISNMV